VWCHDLEFSIGSHKIKDLLLTIHISGAIGVQVHIKITQKDRGISIGGILVEGSLDMGVEVVQSLLSW